jgi:hypothetical protein
MVVIIIILQRLANPNRGREPLRIVVVVGVAMLPPLRWWFSMSAGLWLHLVWFGVRHLLHRVLLAFNGGG